MAIPDDRNVGQPPVERSRIKPSRSVEFNGPVKRLTPAMSLFHEKATSSSRTNRGISLAELRLQGMSVYVPGRFSLTVFIATEPWVGTSHE